MFHIFIDFLSSEMGGHLNTIEESNDRKDTEYVQDDLFVLSWQIRTRFCSGYRFFYVTAEHTCANMCMLHML